MNHGALLPWSPYGAIPVHDVLLSVHSVFIKHQHSIAHLCRAW